jgi:NADPH-dependent curcumin reductase CurA
MEAYNQRWILKSRPKPGPLSDEYFELIKSPIPQIKDGEFLIKNRMLSFDPTQRGWMERDTYMPAMVLGETVRANAIGEIIESKNPQYKVGDRVSGLFGWQEYAISNGESFFRTMTIPNSVSDKDALSIFGITGLTAYFGMAELGKPKSGETVLVSGASGSTGAFAVQIAKLLGAKVIGIAGGESKCQWLLDKAKIDAAIDYKKENIKDRLNELAPKGINVFFDNVGGKTLDTALSHLALKSRIILCGSISTYNNDVDGSIKNYANLIVTRSSIQGFLVSDFSSQFKQGIEALGSWLQAGKICYEVDIQHGIEKAPQTLKRLFEGKNLGKQVLQL